MNNRKNLFSAFLLQIISIISGLILPRLIIGAFGSEVNGLISSITRFVNFIALLEGGLGAVVLAELYKPIEERDFDKIKSILNACQRFFNKLGLIFVGYSLFLSAVYPLIIGAAHRYIYTCSLVLILSFTTFVKYLFSITNSLYLQANQKLYVVNYVSALLTVGNLIVAIVVIKVFPEIHVLKIAADVLFLIQPFVLKRYVEKNVRIKIRTASKNTYVLKNRWSGFSQNLAHFITLNTDVIVATVFIGLAGVSVYSVYMLAISALCTVISMVSGSYQSALGKYFASNDIDMMREKSNFFDRSNTVISLILFSTCLLLINPFVALYTKGVTDANYYQPAFALVMVGANMLYCLREPYRYVVLVAGKFKETTTGAVIEAALNIIVSLLLVIKFGLVGMAIGTLVSVFYRYVYLVLFLRKNVLFISLKTYILKMITVSLVFGVNIIVYVSDLIVIDSIVDFIIYGTVIIFAESIIAIAMFGIEGKLSSWLVKRTNKIGGTSQ